MTSFSFRFHILSDPDGERAIKPYGVWNEQGRIALPAIVAVGRDRAIRCLYIGQDFADRPGDDELLKAIEESELSEGANDATR